MGEQIGAKLSKLDRGDTVVVTVDGVRYDGEVMDAERWMCEFNQGFMESGSTSIYLELSIETVTRHDIPAEHLVIAATEEVPFYWDEPTASVYDPTEDETTTHLGDVTDLEVTNSSADI